MNDDTQIQTEGEREPFTWMPPNANAYQVGGTAACAAGGGVIAGATTTGIALAPFALTSLLPASATQTVAAAVGGNADTDTVLIGLGLVFVGVVLNVISLGIRLRDNAASRAARSRASVY